jgi:hypothetical protein
MAAGNIQTKKDYYEVLMKRLFLWFPVGSFSFPGWMRQAPHLFSFLLSDLPFTLYTFSLQTHGPAYRLAGF